MEIQEIDDENLKENFMLCGQIYKENNTDRWLYVCNICSAYFEEAIPLEQHVYEHFDEPVEGYSGIVGDSNQITTIKIEIEGQSENEQCETLDDIHETLEEDNSEENTEHFNIDFDDDGNVDDNADDDDVDVEGPTDDKIQLTADSSTDTIINDSNKFQIKCSCCENNCFPCFGLLNEHNVQCDKGEYECTYGTECVARFQQNSDLIAHLENHQRNDSFLCNYCAKIFSSEIELELHYGTRVGDLSTFVSEKLKTANEMAVKRDSIVANVTREPTIRTEHNNQVFICDICSKMFEHYSEIKQHMKQFHDASNISELQLKCNICLRQFQWRKDYEQHMLVHKTDEIDKNASLHRCKYCPKRFRHKKRLQTHLKTHSRCDGLFICSTCNKTFKTRENLQQHERIHTGEKPYECTICNKRFNHSSYINIHMRTHTKEKPYQCGKCATAFISKSKLSAHEKKHNNIRPHICSVCDKCFRTPADLRDHFRSEHTLSKPYKCNQCDKRFARSKLLHQHHQLHKNEKQYTCRYCPLKFSQAAGKHGHERRMHKKDIEAASSKQ